MKERIEYFLAKFFIYLVGSLPNETIYKIVKSLAGFLYKFEKRRSSLTKINIKTVFPDLKDEEVDRLARKSYESVAITLAEIILMMNDKLDINEMVINKQEIIEKMKKLSEKNRNGMIIITAHFANWELAAQFLPINGFPMTTIGREGNNKLIEHKITTPFRERYGNKNVYKEKAIMKIVKTLKQNGIVGLLIDQKSSGQNSIKIDFFGIEADTINSIAILKLKYDPIILPVFAIREKNGSYRIDMQEPVEYTAPEINDEKMKIEKITQLYNDILEKTIRKHPEQWFWMHNRWRLV